MTTIEVKPSNLIEHKDIPILSKIHNVGTGVYPELYGWYKIQDTFYPHRKPTIKEITLDSFF